MKFGSELVAKIEAMIVDNTSAYWVEKLEAAGVPVSELYFTEELDEHPQIIENEYVVHLDHDLSGPQSMVAPPHKMSESPPTPQGASPPLGRDTDAILASAGYSEDEIAALRAADVVR
jgi:formyl-CoA transferase